MTAIEIAAKRWADAMDVRFGDDLPFPRDESYFPAVVELHEATKALYKLVRGLK